jgi:hypothetical protein
VGRDVGRELVISRPDEQDTDPRHLLHLLSFGAEQHGEEAAGQLCGLRFQSFCRGARRSCLTGTLLADCSPHESQAAERLYYGTQSKAPVLGFLHITRVPGLDPVNGE